MVFCGTTEVLTVNGNIKLIDLGIGVHKVLNTLLEEVDITISASSGELYNIDGAVGDIKTLITGDDTKIKNQNDQWIDLEDHKPVTPPPVPAPEIPEDHIKVFVNKYEVSNSLYVKLGYLHGRCNYDVYMDKVYAGCELMLDNSTEEDIIQLFEMTKDTSKNFTYKILTEYEDALTEATTDNSSLNYRLLPRTMGDWDKLNVEDYIRGYFTSKSTITNKINIFSKRFRSLNQIEELIKSKTLDMKYVAGGNYETDEYNFSISGISNMADYFEKYGMKSNIQKTKLMGAINGLVPVISHSEDPVSVSNIFNISGQSGTEIILNKRYIVQI